MSVFQNRETLVYAAKHFGYDKKLTLLQGEPEENYLKINPAWHKIFVSQTISEKYSQLVDSYPTDGIGIPVKVLKKIFLTYEERYRKETARLKPELEENFQRCKDFIHSLANNEIPLSTEEIDRRLDKIKIEICDSYTAHLQEMWGSYSPDTHTIKIAADIPKNRSFKTMFHEMMHAISGSTLFYDSEILQPDDMPPHEAYIFHLKHGLSFHGKVTNKTWSRFSDENGDLDDTSTEILLKKHDRFTWLTEAVTSELEALTEVVEELRSYHNVRSLVNSLFTNKDPILKRALREAYFEDYTPNHGVPKWKKLWELINQKIGGDLLIAVDNLINEELKKQDEQNDGAYNLERATRAVLQTLPRNYDGSIHIDALRSMLLPHSGIRPKK